MAETPDVFALPDDEFEKMDVSDFSVEDETPSGDDAGQGDSTPTVDDPGEDDSSSDVDVDAVDDSTPPDSGDDDLPSGEADDPDTEDDPPDDPNTDATEDPDKDDDPSAVDYESEYKKLLAPFRANGKDIQVDSVDEAIRLMSMGANYHKKMTAMKPSLKILKLLEHHDLLDESKINFLIDVHGKNPDAITQLLKDANINPVAIDMEADSQYKPQPRTVSDAELQFDEVLESIQDSPSYPKTLNTLTKDWDDASRNVILQQPGIIATINAHMENGIFDQVTSAVEKQRRLGNLQGMSDIEAYKTTGDQLYAAGQLNVKASKEPTKSMTPKSPNNAAPKSKAAALRGKKKKSASIPRKAASPAKKAVPDILSMTDSEIEAMAAPPFKQV